MILYPLEMAKCLYAHRLITGLFFVQQGEMADLVRDQVYIIRRTKEPCLAP